MNEICSEAPLTSDDSTYFDIVADGQLMTNDFRDDPRFEEFIAKLINTKSRSLYESYVSSMSVGIKNKVHDRLREILEDPPECLKEEDQERLKLWLENEFNATRFFIGASLGAGADGSKWETEREIPSEGKIFTSEENSRYTLAYFPASTRLSYERPLQNHPWRFSANTSLAFSLLPAEITEDYTMIDPEGNRGDTETYSSKGVPSYIKSWGQLALSHNQDKGKFSAEGYAQFYQNPLPDATKFKSWGELQARIQDLVPKIGAETGFEYSVRTYTESQVEGQATRDELWWELSGELSFQPTKRFAVYTQHGLENSNKTGSYDSSLWRQYQGKILPHFVTSWGYVRVGAGGEREWSDYERFDYDYQVSTEEAALNLYSEVQIKPNKSLTVQPELSGNYTYIEGTYNGWYPSVGAYLSGGFSGQKVSLKATYGDSYYARTVHFVPSEGDVEPEADVFQENFWNDSRFEAKIFPNDRFDASAYVSAGFDIPNREGFRPDKYEEQNIGGNLSFSFLQDPLLKLNLRGNYTHKVTTPYYSPASKSVGNEWEIGMSLSLDNVNLRR